MKLFYCLFFFLLGSCLGSFYGVMAKRLPEGKSIIKPRSHCDFCAHPLSVLDLVPIVSFLFLKGRCRYCHKKLTLYEPFLELATGLLFALSYFYYGFSYSFFVSFFLISLLVLIFATDLQYMMILDSPLVVSSLGIFALQWAYFGIQKAGQSVLSGMILFCFMFLVGRIGKWIFKREALGGGDIKLSFVIGLTLGLSHSFAALILSTFLALPYATFSLFTTKNHEVPFGPFLVSALVVVFLFYDKFTLLIQLFQF